MKKRIRHIFICIVLTLFANMTCKAGSLDWKTYYNEYITSSGVKSFKCIYDVSGVNGLQSIEFNVNESGFLVYQNNEHVDLVQSFINKYTQDGNSYEWSDSEVKYSGNKTIKYYGKTSDNTFELILFTENIIEFYACPTKLYLAANTDTSENLRNVSYIMRNTKPTNSKTEYIEIKANSNESKIIDSYGDDVYDRDPYDPEVDITDLDSSEKTRVDDTRSKTEIVQGIGLEKFYNTYMYGKSNFGIIKTCTAYESPNISTLSRVGLSNIKLKDATIEACLFKLELKKSITIDNKENSEESLKEYYDYDEYIKGQYNNNPAIVSCEQGYEAVRLNQAIVVTDEEKGQSTFYFGEVCINNYDYNIKIQAIVNNMKAIYRNIDNYNHNCDEESSKKEIEKGKSLILEYNEIKERLGSKYKNTEGDNYARYLETATAKCINNNTRNTEDYSPLTGALTCSTLFGAPGSTVRTMISNILKFIKYGGPVLMLLLTIMDLVKTVASGEDKDFKKVFQNFLKRFAAATLLFFIDLIIQLLFLIVGLESTCFFD